MATAGICDCRGMRLSGKRAVLIPMVRAAPTIELVATVPFGDQMSDAFQGKGADARTGSSFVEGRASPMRARDHGQDPLPDHHSCASGPAVSPTCINSAHPDERNRDPGAVRGPRGRSELGDSRGNRGLLSVKRGGCTAAGVAPSSAQPPLEAPKRARPSRE